MTRDKVREILRASEGIPTQWPDSKAYVKNGRIQPSRAGHPLGDHLHSASPVEGKTKFISMNDMVDACWQLLLSPTGVSTLRSLQTGQRATISSSVGRLFPFECEVADAQGRPTTHKVKFSVAEQIRAGWSQTTCIAVVEVRERSQVQHLQIHTFYPKYTEMQLQKLLESVRVEG
jgi:hypothetical protein